MSTGTRPKSGQTSPDVTRAALANLGVGPMPANLSQDDTLESEVNNYLADPAGYANIVEFWEVRRNGRFC